MSMTPPLVIANGMLVRAEGAAERGALRVENGRIAALGNAVDRAEARVIDAKGAIVAPGLVDLGVFAIDKPAFHFGGITRAALMPDQGPPLDRPSTVRYAAQSGKPDLWVHPLGAATRGLEGIELAEIALMRDAGARAVATGRRWTWPPSDEHDGHGRLLAPTDAADAKGGVDLARGQRERPRGMLAGHHHDMRTHLPWSHRRHQCDQVAGGRESHPRRPVEWKAQPVRDRARALRKRRS